MGQRRIHLPQLSLSTSLLNIYLENPGCNTEQASAQTVVCPPVIFSRLASPLWKMASHVMYRIVLSWPEHYIFWHLFMETDSLKIQNTSRLEAFPLVKVKREILSLKRNVNPAFMYLVYQSHTLQSGSGIWSEWFNSSAPRQDILLTLVILGSLTKYLGPGPFLQAKTPRKCSWRVFLTSSETYFLCGGETFNTSYQELP